MVVRARRKQIFSITIGLVCFSLCAAAQTGFFLLVDNTKDCITTVTSIDETSVLTPRIPKSILTYV